MDQIESEFGQLSPEAQLGLLERLLHRVRLEASCRDEDWDAGLSAMAADPQVQQELHRINAEFSAAEADGLGNA